MFHTIADPDFGLKILNSLRCGIITFSLDRKISAINEIAIRVFELEHDRYVGRLAEEIFADQPQLLQILNEAYQMNNLPSRAELELRIRDSVSRTIGYTISFIKNDFGKIEGISLFLKDLTLVEQMNEQEKLKDRLAAVGQMAAGLAHEIRNPLAAIELTTSLVKRKLANQSTPIAQLDSIHSEVRKLNKIVTDCLEFVRPLKISTEKTDLQSLLEESLENALSGFSRQGITVIRAFHSTPPVSLDHDQMKQVFVNIIANAVQALGELGTLEIACGPSSMFRRNTSYSNDPEGRSVSRKIELAPYAWVKISDSGCGISEEVLSKIFYPFFTTKEKGSGIGLAIAQKIVDSHRGTIDVSSEVGKGTVFTIKLPY